MKRAWEFLKWGLYQILFFALLWAGYHQGIEWCENLFIFLTYGKLVLTVFVTAVLAILAKAVHSGDFGDSRTREFHAENKDKKRMPQIVPAITNGLIISFLAAYGHFVLAGVWSIMAICNASCLAMVRSIMDKAGEIAARHREENDFINRPTGGDAGWDANDGQRTDDVFGHDDSDLFRMGITTTEREV